MGKYVPLDVFTAFEGERINEMTICTEVLKFCTRSKGWEELCKLPWSC